MKLADLSDWLLWVLKEDKNEQEEKRWWSLYLHTGAITGEPYSEWKERVSNG